MSSTFVLQDRELKSIRVAAYAVGYSSDYVTKLARDQKIFAVQVGRKWYVDQRSLEEYARTSAIEQKLRQQKLGDERRASLLARGFIDRKNTRKDLFTKRGLSRSVFATALVVSLGIGLGATVATYKIDEFLYRSSTLSPLALLGDLTASKIIQNAALPLSGPLGEEFNLNGKIKKENQLTDNVTNSVTFENSVQTKSFADRKEALVLLPKENSEKIEVAAFFSDPIDIGYDQEGKRVVSVVHGSSTNADIPFVVVPVSPSS
jgi:hypothetical protein